MKHFILVLFVFCSAGMLHAQRQQALEPCMEPFYHGVASGDPLHDRVIIWTRVTPDVGYTGPVVVSWKMATDTSMSNVVNQGSVLTDQSKDYTVKADVTGLDPDTYYYYEFKAFNTYSIRGRTKTAPLGNTDSLRFAVVSCANLEAGYFNVYKVLKERNDIDAVLALGDYIYEYESGGYSPNPTANRTWLPANEITTLSDYRTRYSTYHLDEDLRRLHQQVPFIVVWDDHESANDAYKDGAENHNAGEGVWAQRKAYAQQAFFEWLPIRESGDVNDPYRIFREIQYGNLVEFVMLDTRLHGREVQAGTSGATVTDPNRQMLGNDQFTWLGTRLSNTTAQWKVLGQQVMMAPLEVFGVAVNGDQWDGYPAERDRVINYIMNNNIKDVVVITGDIHSSWANDIPTSTYNSSNGAGSAGVEFVAPSVTSPGINLGVGGALIQAANGHMKYVDLSQHGFIILDVTQGRMQADWYYVNTIDNSSSSFSWAVSFYVNHLERFLHESNAASVPRAGMTDVIMAPDCPRIESQSPSAVEEELAVVLGFYPNPVQNVLTVQFYNPDPNECTMQIVSIDGKVVQSEKLNFGQSVWTGSKDVSFLAPGVYFLQIQTSKGVVSKKFIKE